MILIIQFNVFFLFFVLNIKVILFFPKNSNMLLLFKFLICCFKFAYLMEMTFHFEGLGMDAPRIVESSTGKNSFKRLQFMFLICCFKSVHSTDGFSF